jgi:hypothetical protein
MLSWPTLPDTEPVKGNKKLDGKSNGHIFSTDKKVMLMKSTE